MTCASACSATSVIESDVALNDPIATAAVPTSGDDASTPEFESAGPTTNTDDASTAVELASFAVEAAPLFGRVDIEGLPAHSADDVVATATVQGAAIEFPVFADDGGTYILAPLVVDAPGVAGEVAFRLTNGSVTGPVLQLRIDPIAEAPGAAATFLADVETSVEQAAAFLGTNSVELAATELEATPNELRLAKAQQLLVDDGTENDLSSWLLGDGERSTQDQALIDAVVGALVTIEAQLAPAEPRPDNTDPADSPTVDADQSDPGVAAQEPTPEPTPSNRLRGEKGSALQPTSHLTNAAAKIAQGTTCAPSSVVIDSPDRLEDLLAEGRVALRSANGATARLRSDAATALGAGSAIPGPVGIASGLLSTIPAAWLTRDRMDAAQLPSSLDGISFDADPTMFNEDFVALGTLSDVLVTVSSPGGGVIGDVVGTTSTVTTLGANWKTSLGTTLATNLGADWLNNNVAGVCPTTWNVDITASDLYEVNVQQGSLSYDAASGTFSPTDIGREIVTVEAVVAGLTTSKSIEIIINEMGLTVSPEEIQVTNPGDIVALDIRFTNSDTERSIWSTEQGSFVDPVAERTGETPRLLQTPTDPGAYPFWVTVQGNAITGLFEDASRTHPADAVYVTLSEIVISPTNATLTTGTSQQYTARNRDGQIVEVNWSASGGSINESGLYLAGEESGVFRVTAALKANSDIRATVPVRIAEAVCPGRWSLRVAPWMAQITSAFGELTGTGGSMVYTGGDYLLTVYEDGTYDSQRVGLSFLITSEAGSLEMSIDSNESGTVGFVPDPQRSSPTVSVGFATVSEAFSDATVRFLGQERNVSTPSGFAGDVSYTCGNDVLEATTDGVTATWDYLGPAE